MAGPSSTPCVPGEGGVGQSWFCLELTSDHVCLPGEGGVGYSWFCLQVTGDHVPDDDVTPVPPSPGPVPHVRKRRRIQFEDRFDGRLRVVKSIEKSFNGLLIASQPGRYVGTFTVQRTQQQDFSATFDTSTLRATIRREEEELIMFLMDDE